MTDPQIVGLGLICVIVAVILIVFLTPLEEDKEEDEDEEPLASSLPDLWQHRTIWRKQGRFLRPFEMRRNSTVCQWRYQSTEWRSDEVPPEIAELFL